MHACFACCCVFVLLVILQSIEGIFMYILEEFQVIVEYQDGEKISYIYNTRERERERLDFRVFGLQREREREREREDFTVFTGLIFFVIWTIDAIFHESFRKCLCWHVIQSEVQVSSKLLWQWLLGCDFVKLYSVQVFLYLLVRWHQISSS